MESLKILPPEAMDLVKAYASDKVGVHPAAALIKTLKFMQSSQYGLLWPDGLHSTVVQCPQLAGRFMKYPRSHGWTHPRVYRGTSYRRYIHTDFDERHFPQHFDISLRWENMREQDEIEAMGVQDYSSL